MASIEAFRAYRVSEMEDLLDDLVDCPRYDPLPKQVSDVRG
jgi:hypothetical protein